MTSYTYLPVQAYTGPDRCKGCAGAGVTGTQYQMHNLVRVVGEPVLLLDELCPDCGSCGRAAHDGCAPRDHAGWDQHDDHDDDPDQEPDDDAVCPFCNGRGWWVCEGYPSTADAIVYLRVPCGCSVPWMVTEQLHG